MMPPLRLGALLLALAAAAHAQPAPPDRPRTETGTLAPGDDQLDAGEYYDLYPVVLAPGASLDADLRSDAFDPYLIVVGPDEEPVWNDDYEGSRSRARVELTSATGGEYQVLVTSYASEETGPYRLTLTTSGGPKPEGAKGTPAARPAAAPAPPRAAPPATPAAWEAPGVHTPGEPVLYRVGAHWWKRGEVRPFPDNESPERRARTYLLSEETGWPNYYDYEQVVGTERAPFWTGWFVGDWDLSLFVAGMASDRAGNVGVYRDGVVLPPLRVRADGTYTWVIDGSHGNETIDGTWSPAADGPGITLHGGDYGTDWMLYNAGDESSRSVFGRDQMRMTDGRGGSRIGHRR